MNFIGGREVLLGVALGTGSLTSLRFGFVGISEILFFMFVFLGVKKRGYKVTNLPRDFYGWSIYIIGFHIVVISPCLTLITGYFSENYITPAYIVSYVFSVLLLFVMISELRCGIDMGLVTLVYAFSFIVPNLAFIVMGENYINGRFVGLSTNPNQIYFYGSCLVLMAALYGRGLRLPIIVVAGYILFETGSDSFKLSLVIIPLSYISLRLFFQFKLGYTKTLLLMFVVGGSICAMVLYYYSEYLLSLWSSADEGGIRGALLYNALLVTLDSPVLGHGVGSYSGMIPYGSSEAHNTFLDFSMQFGVLVPVLIYFIFFSYLFFLLRIREFFIFSIVVSFILSGMFHFNGRHFFFWVELSIFYYYIMHLGIAKDAKASK